MEPDVVAGHRGAGLQRVGLALEVVELDLGQVPGLVALPPQAQAEVGVLVVALTNIPRRPPTPSKSSRLIIRQAPLTAGTGRATLAAGRSRCKPLK